MSDQAGDGRECLNDDEIAAFLAEELSPEDWARVERHAEDCEACLVELEAAFEAEREPQRWYREDADVVERLTQRLVSRFEPVVVFPLPHPVAARVGLLAPGLAAASGGGSIEQGGTLVSGSWQARSGLSETRIVVTSSDAQLVGRKIGVSVGEVPITGTEQCPHLSLERHGDEARGELVISHSAIAAALRAAAVKPRDDLVRLRLPPPAST